MVQAMIDNRTDQLLHAASNFAICTGFAATEWHTADWHRGWSAARVVEDWERTVSRCSDDAVEMLNP